MKLVLQEFLRMTSGRMLGNTPNTQHRFIEGFVPAYTELAAESADSDFHQKLNPPHGLIPTPGPATVAAKTGKYPVLMIANEHDALGKVIYFTDLWEVFSDDSSETSLGIPNGTPSSNVGIDGVLYNGKILTSHPSVANLYYGAISGTPSWTATTNTLSTGITKLLRNFQDRCLVIDSSSGAFSRRDEVKLVLPDFSIIDGLALGDTFDAQDINTFEDRYVVVFARKTTSPRLSRNTYAFLWNGVPGDSYDKRFTLKGTFKCSIEQDGILYAFTQIGTTLVCYAFNGGSFIEMGRLRNTVISENTNTPKSRVGIEGDYFVLTATSVGNSAATSLLYWNPRTGTAFCMAGPLNGTLPYKAILIAQDGSTATYNRYASALDDTTGYVVNFTLVPTSSKFTGVRKYKSNIVPVPRVKGVNEDELMGRGKIEHLVIEFLNPPIESGDKIEVTLSTKDEYESETRTSQTATVKSTSAASTNARVDPRHAIIDLGGTVTDLSVDIELTTVFGSNWVPLIKRIYAEYEPVALQN